VNRTNIYIILHNEREMGSDSVSDPKKPRRRRFIRGITGVAIGVAVAGCRAPGTSQPDDSDTTGSPAGADEATVPDTDTPTETDSGGDNSVPAAVREHLSDVGNFAGTLRDRTGEETVTVDVGAAGNGGNFAFAPPAIEISVGTTVQWEWTGNGGAHNVVELDERFTSGPAVSGTGVQFERAFGEPGVYNYYCNPHRALGMKGSIVVR
jgi:halocyanin-like protein